MKTYKGIVFIGDGTEDAHGEAIDINSVKLPEGNIPVHENWDHMKTIGSARLTIVGDKVMATINLDYPLDVSRQIPAIGGTQGKDDIDIQCIGLVTANADHRIKPLSEWDQE